MELSIPTGFFIVVYFMGGLQYSAAAFFATYGTVILSMLVAQGLGLLIGAWAMNPKTVSSYLTLTPTRAQSSFVIWHLIFALFCLLAGMMYLRWLTCARACRPRLLPLC